LKGQDVKEQFIDEAKRLFDLQNGSASIPTMQALLIMFIYLALIGRDRAGNLLRFMAFDLAKRMNLENKFLGLDSRVPAEAKRRRVISKVLWGMHVFDTYELISLRPCRWTSLIFVLASIEMSHTHTSNEGSSVRLASRAYSTLSRRTAVKWWMFGVIPSVRHLCNRRSYLVSSISSATSAACNTT